MKPARHRSPMLWASLGLPILLWTQLACVRPTNFGGFDEWLMLDLSSHWIANVAHANRPLGLLWLLPACAWPFTFRVFPVLSFGYLLATAFLLLRLVQRLAPGRPALAFLVSSFFLVWSPGDLARLSTLECAEYAGITFGAVAAVTLFVESWCLQSIPLVMLACALAIVEARSYEGSFGLMAGAPLLLLLTQARSRRLSAWCGAWIATVLMSAAWALLSVTQSHEGTAYQHAVLTPEMRPGELVRRIALQYAYHLGPVVLSPVGELARLAVGTAVGAFAIAFLLVGSASAEFEGDSPPFVRHAATGLVFAGLGYSVILLGTAAPTAFRLEFLSGPGIGLALASAVVAVATQVPKPMRQFVALALAGWIVAVGTGRTVAMQETWDTGSSYPQQMSMLRGLAARVPDLHPGTVILVLDEGRAWRSTFGFYHAVRYLYQGRAVGCVWGAWNALYPASLGPKGLDVEPWPAIRVPWGTPPRTYGYDEIVVVRSTPALTEIVRDWPASLPALPEGAHYDPMSRIAFSSDPIPEQGILR